MATSLPVPPPSPQQPACQPARWPGCHRLICIDARPLGRPPAPYLHGHAPGDRATPAYWLVPLPYEDALLCTLNATQALPQLPTDRLTAPLATPPSHCLLGPGHAPTRHNETSPPCSDVIGPALSHPAAGSALAGELWLSLDCPARRAGVIYK